MNTVLNNILKLMREKGISRKALYEHLGLSKSGFQSWVNNSNQSYMKRLDEISTYLQVTITDLYIGTSFYEDLIKRIEERRLNEEPGLTEKEKNLINLYRMLNDNDKEKINQLLLDILLKN